MIKIIYISVVPFAYPPPNPKMKFKREKTEGARENSVALSLKSPSVVLQLNFIISVVRFSYPLNPKKAVLEKLITQINAF